MQNYTNDCVRRATSWSNVITIINSGQPDLHKISTHHLVDSDHVFRRSRLQDNTWSLTTLPISWWYSENLSPNLGRNSFVIQLPLIPRRCLSKEFIVLWNLSLILHIIHTFFISIMFLNLSLGYAYVLINFSKSLTNSNPNYASLGLSFHFKGSTDRSFMFVSFLRL